jgi:hypothetical protein
VAHGVTRDEIAELFEDENPEALLADGFDAAFVGMARRCGQPTLAVYDYRLGIKVLMEREGMSHDEAEEWMEFNVVGAWVGENTPMWLVIPEPV